MVHRGRLGRAAQLSRDDLSRLSPSVPETVTTLVAAADLELDADVAEWFADSSNRPRPTVLGDIKVRVGRGGAPRKGYVASFSTPRSWPTSPARPNGATTDELCEAFATTPPPLRKNRRSRHRQAGRPDRQPGRTR